MVNSLGGYMPYVGAFIGGAFAVLMALGDGGPGLAVASLTLTLVINIGLENLLEPTLLEPTLLEPTLLEPTLLEPTLLEPKLLGSSLDLHPLLVLLATASGGAVAGMIGLILAAPHWPSGSTSSTNSKPAASSPTIRSPCADLGAAESAIRCPAL